MLHCTTASSGPSGLCCRGGASMGVHVWQRDSAGGNTFATAAPAPQPRPGNKRKLVWTRQDGAAGAAQAAAPGAAQASPFVGAGRQGSGGAGPAHGPPQPCKRARGAPSDASAAEHAAEPEQERSQAAGGADRRAGGAPVRAGPERDGQPDGAAPRPASLRGAAAGVAAGAGTRPGVGRGSADGAVPGRASLRAGDAGGPGGSLEGAQSAGRRGGAVNGHARGPAALRGGATGGPGRPAGAAAQAEPRGQEANGHAREPAAPRAGPAGGPGRQAGAAAQGGPRGERANGGAPGPAGLRAQAAELAMLRRTVAQRQRQLAQERVRPAPRPAPGEHPPLVRRAFRHPPLLRAAPRCLSVFLVVLLELLAGDAVSHGVGAVRTCTGCAQFLIIPPGSCSHTCMWRAGRGCQAHGVRRSRPAAPRAGPGAPARAAAGRLCGGAPRTPRRAIRATLCPAPLPQRGSQPSVCLVRPPACRKCRK